MFGTDIAIDLGTAQLKLFRKNKGIIVDEPSIVAVDLASGRITAYGKKAYDMIGKTSGKVAVVGPMRRGAVSDFSMAEQLMRHYLRQIRESHLIMPRAVVTIPCVLTQVERRSLTDVIAASGVRCAEMTRVSYATPNESSVSHAFLTSGQSESEPITMPTIALSIIQILL